MTKVRGKRYTQEEINYLYTYYPKYGRHSCAKALGRSAGSIWAKAKKLNIELGDVDGFTPIIILAKDLGVNYNTIYNRAKAEGVLENVGAKRSKRRAIVPSEWGHSYGLKIKEQSENENTYAATWFTSREVCKELVIGFGALQRALTEKRGYLVPYFESVEIKEGWRGRWLFNPDDVQRVKRELKNYRKQAKGLTPAKAFWIDAGEDKNRATVLERTKRTHQTPPKKLMINGRVQLFFERAA